MRSDTLKRTLNIDRFTGSLPFLRVFIWLPATCSLPFRMRWTSLLFSGIFTVVAASCHSPTTPPVSPAGSFSTLQTNSKAKILNGIVVHEAGGLTISRAYLSNVYGILIPADNTIAGGDTVCLNLIIAQGWMAENGRVVLGARQSIVTDKGEPVLSSPDLFNGTKINEAQAGHVQLKATITQQRPDTRSFLVSYRVWDKNGSGDVRGSYRLRLAERSRE